MSFHIKTPRGTAYVKYEKSMTYDDKLNEINKLLEKFNESNTSHRDLKMMWFDIGTYLLHGEKDTNVLSYKKNKSIKRREIPTSSVKNQSIEDYLYSGITEELESGEYSDSFTSVNQHFIDEYEKLLIDELYTYKKTETQTKQWQDTNTYKQNMIYSCEDKYKYITDERVYPVKYEDKDKYNKFSNNIKPIKVLVHNGRKGLIDKTKPYINEGIYVDNTNTFKFNNQTFVINNSLESYRVIDEKSEMVSINCFYVPHEDKYHFFDEKVNNITNFVRVYY